MSWEVMAYKTRVGEEEGWAGQVIHDGKIVYDSSKDGKGILFVNEAQAKKFATWHKQNLMYGEGGKS